MATKSKSTVEDLAKVAHDASLAVDGLPSLGTALTAVKAAESAAGARHWTLTLSLKMDAGEAINRAYVAAVKAAGNVATPRGKRTWGEIRTALSLTDDGLPMRGDSTMKEDHKAWSLFTSAAVTAGYLASYKREHDASPTSLRAFITHAGREFNRNTGGSTANGADKRERDAAARKATREAIAAAAKGTPMVPAVATPSMSATDLATKVNAVHTANSAVATMPMTRDQLLALGKDGLRHFATYVSALASSATDADYTAAAPQGAAQADAEAAMLASIVDDAPAVAAAAPAVDVASIVAAVLAAMPK